VPRPCNSSGDGLELIARLEPSGGQAAVIGGVLGTVNTRLSAVTLLEVPGWRPGDRARGPDPGLMDRVGGDSLRHRRRGEPRSHHRALPESADSPSPATKLSSLALLVIGAAARACLWPSRRLSLALDGAGQAAGNWKSPLNHRSYTEHGVLRCRLISPPHPSTDLRGLQLAGQIKADKAVILGPGR